jgi:excisionase family DNA binding protein
MGATAAALALTTAAPAGRHLSVRQAADRLGCSTWFVRKLVHQRRLAACTLLGGRLRIPEADLDRLIAETTTPTTTSTTEQSQ